MQQRIQVKSFIFSVSQTTQENGASFSKWFFGSLMVKEEVM